MRIPLLKSLALAGVVGLAPAAAAQTSPTVLFNFEGSGGDTQGWQPDVAPDENLGENARSLVRTVDMKAIAFRDGAAVTIPAFEGTWLLEAVPNRPIKADQFRGMKYEWATPQDWTSTPILKVAASMQADGANSELHKYRIRVISGTGASADTLETIFDGLKSLGEDGTDGNSFVNDFRVLTVDLSGYAGVNAITAIETAGRHADTADTGGTPIASEVNWGGLVHLDLVTIEPRANTAAEDAQPGLRSLSVPYPNPTASAATLDLDVETGQRVTARVLDVLGRTVQTAFEGAASPGTTLPIRVETSRLPAGTYVVVVEGETFRQSRRITVTR